MPEPEPFDLYAELRAQALWSVSPAPRKPIDCGMPCHCDHYHENDNPDDERGR